MSLIFKKPKVSPPAQVQYNPLEQVVLFACPSCAHTTLALKVMSSRNTLFEGRRCLVCGKKFEPSMKEITE